MIAGYHNDMSLGKYLADPCQEPSLSTGVVSDLVTTTPLHAHHRHPRFGGNGDAPTARGDDGSAVHSLVLGGNALAFAPAEFADWRKKDAQAFRDDARASGLLPLLDRQREPIERAAESARELLATLGSGKCEVSMFWQHEWDPKGPPANDSRVWCRGRADWLSDDGRFDVDLKTVDSADPVAFAARQVYANSYDIQAGLRWLGHRALAKQRDMLWLLVELEAPYACSLVGASDELLELSVRKINHAARIWRRCLDTNEFPGYPTDPQWAMATTGAQWDVEGRGIP